MSTLSIERGPTAETKSSPSLPLDNNNTNPFSAFSPFVFGAQATPNFETKELPLFPASSLHAPAYPRFSPKSTAASSSSAVASSSSSSSSSTSVVLPLSFSSPSPSSSPLPANSSSSQARPSHSNNWPRMKRRFESLRLSPCDGKASPQTAEDSSPEPLPGRTARTQDTMTFKRNRVLPPPASPSPSPSASPSRSPLSSPNARSARPPQEESPFQSCAFDADSFLEGREKKKYTHEQVKALLTEALVEQEQRIREEYSQTLHRMLREQFENFSTFNQDYISRMINQSDFSYLS